MGMHVLIAESRNIYRTGLRTLFSHDSSVTSFDEAMTCEGLKSKLTINSFDFVVVHQSLITDMALLPRNHFIILASEPDKSTFVAALNHGARGYFLEDPLEDLLRATLHLPKGGCLLDPALTLWALEHISKYCTHELYVKLTVSTSNRSEQTLDGKEQEKGYDPAGSKTGHRRGSQPSPKSIHESLAEGRPYCQSHHHPIPQAT